MSRKPHRPQHTRILLTGCLWLLLLTHADARVFFRWGGAAQVTQALESFGGTVAYTGAVTLNGGDGSLTLFAFDDELDTILGALPPRLDADLRLIPTAGVYRGVIKKASSILTLIVFELPSEAKTYVFTLEQSPQAYQHSSLPPTRPTDGPASLLSDISPRFTAQDHEANMSLAVMDASSGEPDSIQRRYAQALASTGWNPVFAQRVDPAMTAYVNGGQFCLILALPGPMPGQALIAVLHKQPGG